MGATAVPNGSDPNLVCIAVQDDNGETTYFHEDKKGHFEAYDDQGEKVAPSQQQQDEFAKTLNVQSGDINIDGSGISVTESARQQIASQYEWKPGKKNTPKGQEPGTPPTRDSELPVIAPVNTALPQDEQEAMKNANARMQDAKAVAENETDPAKKAKAEEEYKKLVGFYNTMNDPTKTPADRKAAQAEFIKTNTAPVGAATQGKLPVIAPVNTALPQDEQEAMKNANARMQDAKAVAENETDPAKKAKAEEEYKKLVGFYNTMNDPTKTPADRKAAQAEFIKTNTAPVGAATQGKLPVIAPVNTALPQDEQETMKNANARMQDAKAVAENETDPAKKAKAEEEYKKLVGFYNTMNDPTKTPADRKAAQAEFIKTNTAPVGAATQGKLPATVPEPTPKKQLKPDASASEKQYEEDAFKSRQNAHDVLDIQRQRAQGKASTDPEVIKYEKMAAQYKIINDPNSTPKQAVDAIQAFVRIGNEKP